MNKEDKTTEIKKKEDEKKKKEEEKKKKEDEKKEEKKKKEEEKKKKEQEKKKKKEEEDKKKETEKKVKSPPKQGGTGMKRTIKLVVVGDGAIGKTSLLISYTTKAFPKTEYIPTVFDNYNAIEECDSQPINLILWDTAGQEEYDNIRTMNYPGTDCVIICYSVESRTSFKNIETKWLPELEKYCQGAVRIFAGLKCDLLEDPEVLKKIEARGETPVTVEDGEQLTSKLGGQAHFRVSAMSGTNVNELFINAMQVTVRGKSRSNSRVTKKP